MPAVAEPAQRAARRERQEPSEQRHPLPLAMKVLTLAMAAWGIGYLLSAGDWPLAAGDRRTPVAAVTAADGATVYAGNCAACHQANGQGLPGVFPPLAGARWVTGRAEVPVQILLHGIQGEIEVLGQVYSGVMPAFAQLSDAEIAAVLSHVRGAWGNQAGPVSAEEVVAQRQRFADRSQPWQGGAELDAVLGP